MSVLIFICLSQQDEIRYLTMEHWPERSDWHAISIATMPVEQAVFSWRLGPLRSKYQLSLLAKIEAEVPVAVFIWASSGSLVTSLIYSSAMDAANTAVSVPATSSTGIPAGVRRKPSTQTKYTTNHPWHKGG